jgi:uncharacterized Fe-S cluster protein YjdI
MAEEQPYPRGVARVYEGAGIRVGWEPRLCIHTTNCLRFLPQVFDGQTRPWIHPDAAPADAVAYAIERCPSGALTYERTDGGPREDPGETTTVEPRPNGPLFVRGRVQVVDASGEVLRSATRLALCRCGNSQNKPFCDLSHRAAGFQA